MNLNEKLKNTSVSVSSKLYTAYCKAKDKQEREVIVSRIPKPIDSSLFEKSQQKSHPVASLNLRRRSF